GARGEEGRRWRVFLCSGAPLFHSHHALLYQGVALKSEYIHYCSVLLREVEVRLDEETLLRVLTFVDITLDSLHSKGTAGASGDDDEAHLIPASVRKHHKNAAALKDLSVRCNDFCVSRFALSLAFPSSP